MPEIPTLLLLVGITMSVVTAVPPDRSVNTLPDDDLLTIAQRSDYQATATYDEVVTLLDRIGAKSSNVMRRLELGETSEGRTIPLVILADPPIETARQARDSGKLVIFAFGTIHAGEVCGKEALLMLIGELALTPDHPLLNNLILAIAPIYNADGNERMSPDNRRGQIGPAQGMGQRPNAQGLDLNRDYVKLDSPEARAQVRFLTEWDPHLTIDTHTTNGSKHRYVLTYSAPLNPSGYGESIRYVRDTLLPEVTQRLRERTGYETFFYGNLDRGHTTWSTYSSQPRFGGPYRGLRGQMSILSEAYAYATYKDRVLATREFVREILTYASDNADEIMAIHQRARQETIAAGRNPQPDDVVGIRHHLAAFANPAIILGYEGNESVTPADYSVVHRGRFEPTLSVRRPFAYIIPPGCDPIIANLKGHGIALEPFSGPAAVEVAVVTSLRRRERPFQGRNLVTLETMTHSETARAFPEGSTLVRTAQPLGNLIVYILEAQSEDGLAAWNFFGDELRQGGQYPIVRVPAPMPADALSR